MGSPSPGTWYPMGPRARRGRVAPSIPTQASPALGYRLAQAERRDPEQQVRAAGGYHPHQPAVAPRGEIRAAVDQDGPERDHALADRGEPPDGGHPPGQAVEGDQGAAEEDHRA